MLSTPGVDRLACASLLVDCAGTPADPTGAQGQEKSREWPGPMHDVDPGG